MAVGSKLAEKATLARHLGFCITLHTCGSLLKRFFYRFSIGTKNAAVIDHLP